MSAADLELERHIPALRRFAWSLTRRSWEADDLVQDCLERAISRGQGWRAEGTPRAWLFSILYNGFVSDRRRAARRPTVGIEDAPELPQPGGQDQRLAAHEMLAALDLLPADQRAVVLLVGVEDLSYAEAARALDVPIGTVMSRLSRGRERLRQILSGEVTVAAGRLRAVR